jgi:site-specific DNA-methyltransferase (adenine-specific)
MNLPYGRAIRRWLRKAREENVRGATVVCLVPARTDTAWWHDDAMRA